MGARSIAADGRASSLDHLGPHLWDRETRFRYRGQRHHRRETVYLARITDTAPTLRPRHTANEKRDSSATVGGANPNSPPAQTKSCHPTCQPCSPMPSQDYSASPSTCTTKPWTAYRDVYEAKASSLHDRAVHSYDSQRRVARSELHHRDVISASNWPDLYQRRSRPGPRRWVRGQGDGRR
jgi:hypothetical protein